MLMSGDTLPIQYTAADVLLLPKYLQSPNQQLFLV